MIAEKREVRRVVDYYYHLDLAEEEFDIVFSSVCGTTYASAMAVRNKYDLTSPHDLQTKLHDQLIEELKNVRGVK
jgi:hypothetical protein